MSLIRKKSLPSSHTPIEKEETFSNFLSEVQIGDWSNKELIGIADNESMENLPVMAKKDHMLNDFESQTSIFERILKKDDDKRSLVGMKKKLLDDEPRALSRYPKRGSEDGYHLEA